MRALYFDIDGVLLDYEDQPKPALMSGALEEAVRSCGFDSLVCVSGWSDLAHSSILQIPEGRRAAWLYRRIAPVFPSREWLLARLLLTVDTDHRASYIDLTADWFYVDDWADEYFTKAHGPDRYHAELGRRICLADPHADGSDVLRWLRGI